MDFQQPSKQAGFGKGSTMDHIHPINNIKENIWEGYKPLYIKLRKSVYSVDTVALMEASIERRGSRGGLRSAFEGRVQGVRGHDQPSYEW